MEIKPEEKILVGGVYLKDGKVHPDDVSLRIFELINNQLIKIKTDSSGWNIIYQDPNDNRYWELSYPNSGQHGGGAPILKNIDSI